jgi:hypothetical protein
MKMPWRKTLLFISTLIGGFLSISPAAAATDLGNFGQLNGFVDARYGTRLQADQYQRETSLGETRLQLGLNRMGAATTLQLRADFYYDNVADQGRVSLEKGAGWVDLREANLLFTPHALVDVKFGRQILTWGTGDLLFINDLFPKDWQSFFIGRDVEYLKAPSDAILISMFPELVNIDLVYIPKFDPDRYIRGERLSYWNSSLNRIAGRDAIASPITPDNWFSDDELTVRLSKTIGGYETAIYAYDGFWKSPAGFDPVANLPNFPRLSVYGTSLRGILGPGIANLEVGYYDSRDDRRGDDPFLPNSEWRFLAGYEQEVVRNVTLSGQYYLEVLQQYDAYMSTAQAATARDRLRHVVTMRLTWMMLSQNLNLSLFTYYSPSDADGYLRPGVKYKLTDAWQLSCGANLFFGRDEHTFFGQFEDNNNIYAGVRYNF